MLKDQISREIKPTNHDCRCNECHKAIKKGETIIKVLSDVYNNKSNSYVRYHPACFLGACLRIAKISPKGSFMKGFKTALALSGQMVEKEED